MFLSADIIQINVLIQQNHQSSTARFFLPLFVKEIETYGEYYGAAEPPVRCGESHLSGLTEPPHFVY